MIPLAVRDLRLEAMMGITPGDNWTSLLDWLIELYLSATLTHPLMEVRGPEMH